MEHGFVDAALFLRPIVIQKTEGILTQHGNSYEVASGEQRHAKIAEVPHEIERGKGTYKYKCAT